MDSSGGCEKGLSRTDETAENGVEMRKMTCGVLTQPGMFLLRKQPV